jgi:hypothetical protein
MATPSKIGDVVQLDSEPDKTTGSAPSNVSDSTQAQIMVTPAKDAEPHKDSGDTPDWLVASVNRK